MLILPASTIFVTGKRSLISDKDWHSLRKEPKGMELILYLMDSKSCSFHDNPFPAAYKK